jgi:hypothetical protein
VTFISPLRYGRLLAALALSLICLALTAAAAHAGVVKPLDFSVTTNAPYAGITMHNSFVMTLTNKTKTQELGSANIGLPAGFTLSEFVSDHGSDPVLDGSTLKLRNLAVPPLGGSVKVTMTLQAPCAPPTGSAWTVEAKQSNDFNGSGNDLQPVSGTLAMTLTGKCRLEFGVQPGDALKNRNIRAVDFEPSSTSLFTVRALDGRDGDQAQLLEWFTGDIQLRRTPSSTALDAVSSPSYAQPGVATFATAQIGEAGIWRLLASADGFSTNAAQPAQSGQFTIVDQLDPCPKQGCSVVRKSSTVTVPAGQDDAAVVLSDGFDPVPKCDGYTPPADTAWYDFFVTASREKTITTTYTRAELKGYKAELQICFAMPDRTLLDPPLFGKTFNYDNEGTTEEGSVVLLPPCPLLRTTACVVDRGPFGSGGQFITFWAPGSTVDPRYH